MVLLLYLCVFCDMLGILYMHMVLMCSLFILTELEGA